MKKRSPSSRLAGIGFELSAAVAGFALVGYWIGNHYGKAALGIVIGAVLGLIGGMYNLIRATLAGSGGAAEREQDSNSTTNG